MGDETPYCPLCSQKQTECLGRRGTLGPIEGYAPYVENLGPFDREVFLCRICGLQFIHPTYDETDLRNLYGIDKYELFVNATSPMGDPGKREISSVVSRLKSGLVAKGVSSWREEFFGRHGRKPRLLDIGCGRGGNLWAFHDLGFEVTGIDMSRDNVRFVKKRLEFEAVHTSLEEFASEEPFDFVLASHVIEHATCPHTFMENAMRLLSDEGLLMIYTPLTDDWGTEEHRYRDIYHVLFFDHFTLGFLAAMHGLASWHLSTAFVKKNSNIVNLAAIFVRDKSLAGTEFSPDLIRALRAPYETVRKEFLTLIRDHLAEQNPVRLADRVRSFYRQHGFLATAGEIGRRAANILSGNRIVM